MDKLAPVIVFAYNRPDHIYNTLEALNKVEHRNETDLFVFCDGWKNEANKKSVLEVWDTVDMFASESEFRSLKIVKSEKNKGLADSIINGVTEIISRYGKVIVLEDDLIVSKFFLQYMNEALNYYEKKPNIWAISGYSFPMAALDSYDSDVFLAGRACSWGWATWCDRWNTVDWNVSDYKSFCHNWIKRYQFSKWGFDLPLMLDRQVNAGNNSWAIRWCYQAYKAESYTVYPKKSFLKNIGLDGTGTHTSERKSTQKYIPDVYSDDEYHIVFKDLAVNKHIRKDFAKTYSYGRWIDIKAQIKGLLQRIGLISYK